MGASTMFYAVSFPVVQVLWAQRGFLPAPASVYFKWTRRRQDGDDSWSAAA